MKLQIRDDHDNVLFEIKDCDRPPYGIEVVDTTTGGVSVTLALRAILTEFFYKNPRKMSKTNVTPFGRRNPAG